MTNTITFATYKAASDRIRQGRTLEMDHAICDLYDESQTAGPALRGWYDLPQAGSAWREAGRATER